MRAVVTQIQGKFAAILSEDGRIEKITNKNYVIGQVIEMKENVKAKNILPHGLHLRLQSY